MPVGFKNRTDGNVQVAVERAARRRAALLLGVDRAARGDLHTTGNPDGHVILRGGSGPEPRPRGRGRRAPKLRGRARRAARHRRLARQQRQGPRAPAGRRRRDRRAGRRRQPRDRRGHAESFLVAGRQNIAGPELTYGQSITDACMDWDATVDVLDGSAPRARPPCDDGPPPRREGRAGRRRPHRRLGRPRGPPPPRRVRRGWNRSPAALEIALARGAIDEAVDEHRPRNGGHRDRRRRGRALPRVVGELCSALPDAVVTDVGSTKQALVDAVYGAELRRRPSAGGRRGDGRRARPRGPVRGRDPVPHAARPDQGRPVRAPEAQWRGSARGRRRSPPPLTTA